MQVEGILISPTVQISIYRLLWLLHFIRYDDFMEISIILYIRFKHVRMIVKHLY